MEHRLNFPRTSTDRSLQKCAPVSLAALLCCACSALPWTPTPRDTSIFCDREYEAGQYYVYCERLTAEAFAAREARSTTNLAKLKSDNAHSGRVAMVQQAGVFWVKGIINDGLPLDFIVDSGATEVTVPENVVSTLLLSGTLTNNDFIGQVTRVLADGTEVPSTTFRIGSIKIGDAIAYNVVGSVTSRKGDLLLGQSFLRHFKHWSIDNTTHELTLDE